MHMVPLLLLVIGCPEPVDELPASAPGAGIPGAPGDVPPPPAGAPAQPAPNGPNGAAEAVPTPTLDGGGPSAAGGAGALPPTGMPGALGGDVPAPPPGGVPGPSIEELSKRSLKSLASGGATVKIHGRLEGAKAAQVDFTAVSEQDGRKVPELLQIVQVTDGTFTVEAPATFARDIYVSATADTKGDGIGPDDPGGIASSPIRLAGADVDVVIPITTDGTWAKAVPWYAADLPLVAGTGEPGASPPPPAATPTSSSGWVFTK